LTGGKMGRRLFFRCCEAAELTFTNWITDNRISRLL
jgi:hypothetical protein